MAASPYINNGEVGFGGAPHKYGSSLFAHELLQLESKRAQLEQVNLLLRCHLENTRLAQENDFLQQKLHQQQTKSWNHPSRQDQAKNELAASIAKGFKGEHRGGGKEHSAKQLRPLRTTVDSSLPHSCDLSEQSTTEPSSLRVSFSTCAESHVAGEINSSGHQLTTCMMRNIPADSP
jgi:hypothetical protein